MKKRQIRQTASFAVFFNYQGTLDGGQIESKRVLARSRSPRMNGTLSFQNHPRFEKRIHPPNKIIIDD